MSVDLRRGVDALTDLDHGQGGSALLVVAVGVAVLEEQPDGDLRSGGGPAPTTANCSMDTATIGRLPKTKRVSSQ